MNIKKIIIWITIWIITAISIGINNLEENSRILIEIINSGTFSYITLDLLINQLYENQTKKNSNNITYLIIMLSCLNIVFFFFKPIHQTQGVLIIIFFLLFIFIYGLNQIFTFTLKKIKLY